MTMLHVNGAHPVLAGLNERQNLAVVTTDGPVLVIAGPGSGKTRSLTHRIAYLMASGVTPRRILAVTFTNKAADEMRERVNQLLSLTSLMSHAPDNSEAAKRLKLNTSITPFIGTFHSFAASLLRQEASGVGYRPNFTIYDADDALALVKELMKELRIDPKRFPAPVLASVISNLKADLIAPIEYEGREAEDPFGRTVGRVYQAYQERLRFANAMDFDDLLFYSVRLLAEREPVRRRWQERFGHIHVDEYQDTSPAQYELVSMLAAEHRNLFVIGDDAQSIYSWRRADYRNILRFERDWPDAMTILLEENYRSTPQILQAANHLIRQNRGQKPKVLWTKNPPGEQLSLSCHENERAEAEFIAEEIAALNRAGRAWNGCAVLYRTNAQSRALEEALIEQDVPYTIIGGIRFFSRREVKDILAYLRYLSNPDDLVALKRIINVPARGIGPKTFLAFLAGKSAELAARDRERLKAFEATAAKLRAGLADKTLAEFLRFLIKTVGYETYLAATSREAEARIENIRELISVARTYDALPIGEATTRLLEAVALLSEQDELEEKENRVRLMTIHASKGLEFPVVFLVGLEEGLLPHAKAVATGPAELDEERRLAYVAMTRAKERLYLTWAISRTLFGELEVNMPSRFLRELPAEVIGGQVGDAAEILISDEA